MSIRSLVPRPTPRDLSAFAALSLVLGSPPSHRPSARSSPTTKAYAKFGDQDDYSAVPGGSFEEASTGWTFITSKLTLGNDGYNVIPGKRSGHSEAGSLRALRP